MTNDEALELKVGDRVEIRSLKEATLGKEVWKPGTVNFVSEKPIHDNVWVGGDVDVPDKSGRTKFAMTAKNVRREQ